MQSSGMWKCAVGQKVSHVLMDWSLGLLSHAHGHYSPSKHCRLLTQCHSVTPEKTWIFSNIAVRNSNVVCHTSMSVNRSEHWAAAIMYHFNCKISESSDECDSSKSGDCQFEKKKRQYWYINSLIYVLYVTTGTYCRLGNCLSEILLCFLYFNLGSAGKQQTIHWHDREVHLSLCRTATLLLGTTTLVTPLISVVLDGYLDQW